MAIEYSRSASSSVNDDPWAATQRHAAAACLQGVMSALHPELRRFVRVCVREHVLKGMPMRNAMSSAKYGEVDHQVTTLLDTKMTNTTAATADFLAYLQFVDQNWYKYIADLDFHGDLRATVKQSVEIRNKVARQVPVSSVEYEQALKVLRRFAELLAVQQTTKDLIEALIEAADIEVTTTSPQSSSSESASTTNSSVRSKKRASSKVGAQTWTIVALCWVILALLWTIMVIQDEDARDAVKPWIPRFSLWDLSLDRVVMAPAPVPESWSLLSSLKAFVPAPAPAPTPEPVIAASSWLGGWL
ncbi:hypothetical protein Gpo141_00010175 [Globisporangium polare]